MVEMLAQELARLRAVQIDRGHVRHVEHAGARAHGGVFGDRPFVLHRHVPAGEIDEAGTERLVLGMQGGFLQRHSHSG